jgi:hypothetical protein
LQRMLSVIFTIAMTHHTLVTQLANPRGRKRLCSTPESS